MLSKLFTILLLFFFTMGGYTAYTAVTLPNVRKALEVGVEPSQTSKILGRDGSIIMSYGKFQHKPLPLSDMSPSLIDALIATEDRRFFQHYGIDPIGIARATVQNIRAKGVHEGGSTLTQQLARNIFLSNERSIQRKMKEALLAIKLEQQLTKKQILELYLNNIYFGEGAYGVGAASNIYFGKSPKNLNKAESALLAGLPQAPSLYSPFSNPNLAIKRRNEVLDNMVEANKLAKKDAETLKKRPLKLNPNGRALSSADKAPFFNRYVIREISSMFELDEQSFWQQGLKIYTTLDPRAQQIADLQVKSLSNAFGRRGKKQQAALLSLDSKGGMIAYIGGKDFSVTQYDRVSQAHRQAGSLFKVFVYTTAIEHGFSPLTVYKDAPVEFGNWKPENYDKGHRGYMTLAQALVQSNNIIAVKLLNDLSPDAVIQTARRMGIKSTLQPNLSLGLGAADVTLEEMTGAFSVLSNDGIYKEPYAIEKILDRKGRVLYQHRPEKRVVLQRTSRDTMVKLMQGVVRFGTGRAASFGRDAAGKTGTSDNYKDAWFIGYTPEITTGVWVGNDDNSKMPGVTGGSIPARIWRAYMSRLMAGMPRHKFDLSYALPVEEKDFFVYNLDNLSSSEAPASPEEATTEDMQLENPQEGAEKDDAINQETYSFIDGKMQSGNESPEGPPETVPYLDENKSPEPENVDPQRSLSPGGRFEQSPTPPVRSKERFPPGTHSNGRSATPNSSRPIVDPVGATGGSSPRTVPQQP